MGWGLGVVGHICDSRNPQCHQIAQMKVTMIEITVISIHSSQELLSMIADLSSHPDWPTRFRRETAAAAVGSATTQSRFSSSMGNTTGA